LGLIQEDLNSFTASWNKHGIRTTTGNRSPEQLLILNEHLTAAAPEEVDEDYGIDDDDTSTDDIDQVVINPIFCPLNEHQKLLFTNLVKPVSRSTINNYRDEFFADEGVEESFIMCMYGVYIEAYRRLCNILMTD
jgi:hypothetical protein